MRKSYEKVGRTEEKKVSLSGYFSRLRGKGYEETASKLQKERLGSCEKTTAPKMSLHRERAGAYWMPDPAKTG